MPEKLPQQEETVSEKEKALKEIEEVIDIMERDYEWGGGEDNEGNLQPGIPDFKEARKKVRQIILGNTE